MPELKLIEAVKKGDIHSVENLLNSGEDIEQKDDYGWTALNWAAGKGNSPIIIKLLEAGANITNAGRDKRTAYQIALAAAQVESASVLLQAAQKASVFLDETARPYCKAYFLADLTQFPDWPTNPPDLTDDTVVFLHQDFSVTRSMFHSKEVVFDFASPAWKTFCTNQLAFAVPTDLELAEAFAAGRSANASRQVL